MASVSYQLYSSRKFDLDDTLAMVARLGITEVEGYAPLYEDTDATRRRLDANALIMPTGHFAFDRVEAEPARCIAIARALGIETIVVPFLPAGQRPYDTPGWRRFGTRLAEAGKPIREAGLGYGWHNHDFEFRALPDGSLPVEHLAESPAQIELELDLAWIHVAGHDPVAWIERFAGNITAVHVKDCAHAGELVNEDGWADVGHGVMDWSTIAPAMQSAGVQRYILEHDNPSDPERFASRSFATVKDF